MSITAIKQAVEKIRIAKRSDPIVSPYVMTLLCDADELLRQAIEQSEKPVAWAVVGDGDWGKWVIGNQFETNDPPNHNYWINRGYELIPLYTTPQPQREKQEHEDEDSAGVFVEFTDGMLREVTDGSAGASLYTAPQPQQEPLTDAHPLMVFAKECVLGAYQESELADAAHRAIDAARGIKGEA